jgi:hypothetical protein
MMDGLLQFSLPSGRRVHLSHLHVVPTRTDFTDAKNPKEITHQIPELITKLFSDDTLPLLIKEVRPNILPPVTCIGLFHSELVGPSEDQMGESVLAVCWFVKRLDPSVMNLVCEGLAGVAWEEHARDYFYW